MRPWRTLKLPQQKISSSHTAALCRVPLVFVCVVPHGVTSSSFPRCPNSGVRSPLSPVERLCFSSLRVAFTSAFPCHRWTVAVERILCSPWPVIQDLQALFSFLVKVVTSPVRRATLFNSLPFSAFQKVPEKGKNKQNLIILFERNLMEGVSQHTRRAFPLSSPYSESRHCLQPINCPWLDLSSLCSVHVHVLDAGRQTTVSCLSLRHSAQRSLPSSALVPVSSGKL